MLIFTVFILIAAWLVAVFFPIAMVRGAMRQRKIQKMDEEQRAFKAAEQERELERARAERECESPRTLTL